MVPSRGNPLEAVLTYGKNETHNVPGFATGSMEGNWRFSVGNPVSLSSCQKSFESNNGTKLRAKDGFDAHPQLLNLPDPEDLFLNTSGCGKKSSELFSIPDFTSRMVPEQDKNVIHLSKNAKLSITDGSRHPKFSEISVAGWNVANTRILYRLIETGQLQTCCDIKPHLCCTVKINQLALQFSCVD